MRPRAYRMLKHSTKCVGITVKPFGPHAVRATVAANAYDRGSDTATQKEWL